MPAAICTEQNCKKCKRRTHYTHEDLSCTSHARFKFLIFLFFIRPVQKPESGESMQTAGQNQLRLDGGGGRLLRFALRDFESISSDAARYWQNQHRRWIRRMKVYIYICNLVAQWN